MVYTWQRPEQLKIAFHNGKYNYQGFVLLWNTSANVSAYVYRMWTLASPQRSLWWRQMIVSVVAGSGRLCVWVDSPPWGQGRLFSLLEARGVSTARCVWQHGKAKKLHCVTSSYMFSQSFSNEWNIGYSRFTPMWSSCLQKCFLLPRSAHSILLNSLRSF